MSEDKITANAQAMLEGGPEGYAAARDKLYKAWDDADADGKEFWRQVFGKYVEMQADYLEQNDPVEWEEDGTAYHLYMSACMYWQPHDPRPSPPLTPEQYAEMEREMGEEYEEQQKGMPEPQ
jgi:hypothetical protein